MTAFVTRTSTHLGVDKILTSPTAFALYENLLAAFEKDAAAVAAGAVLANNYVVEAMINALAVTEPKLANSAAIERVIGALACTEPKIGAAAISQGKLKTATASGSLALGSGAQGSYTLTGGTYSWWTASGEETGSGLPAFAFGNGNTAAGVIGIKNTVAANATFFVDERYVQASPPYNLGSGDISLFVYALIAPDGSLRGVSAAPDPTWAYHGPTDIRVEYFNKWNKPCRRCPVLNGRPLAEAIRDPLVARAFLAGDIKLALVDQEITPEYKNRDMNLFPHPWVGNDLGGATAVLLDPVSPLVDRLGIIARAGGAREVRRLIEEGYVEIDNVPLDATAPAALVPVAARMRRS